MKKNYTFVLFPVAFLCFFAQFILGTASTYAQQAVGVHPNVDAGFENQAVGNLGLTQSAADWTYVSSGSTQSRGISATGGYGGPKFLSLGRGSTTSNSSTTANSNQVTTGTFLPSTNYIFQFHYRQSAGFTGNPDSASFVFISNDGSSAGRRSTKINLGTPPANWTSFSTIVTSDTGQLTIGTCGINIKNQALPASVVTTIDIDNFVVYPADNQSSPARDVTAPDPVTGFVAASSPGVINLSWNAPASGVDNGGFMVVRFTADPSSEPAPLQNAVYKANITNTIGTTGTVVYVGTSTLFSDATALLGVNYWYRVYTVDKAFNYSVVTSAGPSSALPKINYYYSGSGSSSSTANWWTNKNATGTNPPNFSDAGQIFRIITNASLLTGFTISGNGSTLIIGEPSPGVPAMTVTFDSVSVPGIDTIYQSSDGNPTVLNFNTSVVPSINLLFDIFTQVHYRAPGTSVGTSKVYDKIFVENGADVIFTGAPAVTSSFIVDAGSSATIGVLSSRYLTVNPGATVTINGKLTTPKLIGLVSSNVGTAASTFGAIQFISTGDVVLGPNSTIEYSGISSSTTQTITPRTDYVNMIISGTGVSKTISGTTALAGSLTMNTSGATGAILAGGVFKVNGNLVLTQGNINSDATNILELGAASNIVGGSNTSYVSGPMRRNTDATTAALFPVGKGGVYGGVTITPATAAASVYKAEFFNVAYSNVVPASPLTSVSSVGYWDVSRVSGSDAAVGLGLYGTAIAGALVSDEVVVAQYNGSNWQTVSATPINPGDATTGTAVSNVLNSFGSFTFGVKPSSVVPVTLLSFSGQLNDGMVQLTWVVVEEKNVQSYVIEESKDGKSFYTIGNVKSQNVANTNHYDYIGSSAIKSNSYFRVKVVNLDGKVQYTKVIQIKPLAKEKLEVFNNVVTDKLLRVQLSGLNKGNYTLSIMGVSGVVVQNLAFNVNSDLLIQNIQLNESIAKGLYFVRLMGINTKEIKRVIIQ